MAVQVERRDIVTVVVHGSLAGLVAGVILGAATVTGSLALSGDAWLPFRFAAAFVVGPGALGDQLSLPAAVLLGAAIHFSLAALFGIVFVGLLALTYQLSARSWLLVVYGAIFAFGVWEVDFMAAVPALFPFLVDRLDLPTQLWAGILSYALVYGPILGAYVAIVRPGVIGDWHAVGAPAGVFPRTSSGTRD
jgi:hypothetical protein